MRHFLFLLLATAFLAFSPPIEAFAQSTTKAVSKASVSTANQYLIPASEVKVSGPIYAESAIIVDSGQAIKFKISATGTVSSAAPILRTGTGSPLNVISAPVGSIFLRLDGGTSTTLYIKTAGVDSAGWTGK